MAAQVQVGEGHVGTVESGAEAKPLRAGALTVATSRIHWRRMGRRGMRIGMAKKEVEEGRFGAEDSRRIALLFT